MLFNEVSASQNIVAREKETVKFWNETKFSKEQLRIVRVSLPILSTTALPQLTALLTSVTF